MLIKNLRPSLNSIYWIYRLGLSCNAFCQYLSKNPHMQLFISLATCYRKFALCIPSLDGFGGQIWDTFHFEVLYTAKHTKFHKNKLPIFLNQTLAAKAFFGTAISHFSETLMMFLWNFYSAALKATSRENEWSLVL